MSRSRLGPLNQGEGKSITSNRRHVLTLLSGGIDSSACVAYYVSQQFDVSTLFLNYRQLSANREHAAASAICNHYGIRFDKIVCSGFREWPGGYVLGRNALLLHAALMAFKHTAGIVAIGIHSGASFPDCSEEFVRSIQTLFDLYTDGRVVVGAPFLRWNKREIWDYCGNQEVPVELTYSCELGKEQPCGECLSCKDLEVLRAGKK